ncbi:MAG: VWA domain-containing protein [Candidatus Cloacimonetes bacterium]|nr:VWA domain-containing protein [Candidatus Cloacimonadota bacterium]
MFEFLYPYWFIALILVPAYIVWELIYQRRKKLRIPYSRLQLLKKASGHETFMQYIPIVLRTLTIVFLVIAMTRPRLGKQNIEIEGQGIDIVLAIDVSGSMMAVDFKPKNRLEAAKVVADEFIDNRKNDRIGLVVFSEYAITQCPLTQDYNILKNLLKDIEINQESSSTAIGMGLATAVSRLHKSEAKSKVVILITDGKNNTGKIDPFGAAELAKTYGIRVYPIAVGSNGLVDYPNGRGGFTKVQIEMDLPTLNRIAQITGTTKASLARNTEQLKQVVEEIDRLEKSKFKMNKYTSWKELFPFWLLLSFLALVLEMIYRLILRKEII